jgi:hypothetical protein
VGSELFIRHRYQAEAATTEGVVLRPSRALGTLAAEASGRQAVRLQPGQYVEFTLRAPANAVDVRYSIPDSANGTGTTATLDVVAGDRRLTGLALTSAYSWFYGGYPFTNDPRAGGAHHFYDDTRALLGTTLPEGSKVRFVATAPTVVDLADFEQVAPPPVQPPGSLAVTDFGADATGNRDSTAAFRSALAAGRASGKPVWIPPGTFTITAHLSVDEVTLLGAGPWYSVLRGEGVGIYGNPATQPSTNVRLADFAIFGEVRDRDDSAQVNGIGGALSDSSISNLWIQHTKVGMWLDGPFDGLTISGCRIQDTTADGVNLHQAVAHTVVENTLVRNTGDDGLAIWSDASTGEPPAHDNVFRFDTVELPILANGIAFYGGTDNSATDNVVQDTVTEGGGIHVGNRFSSTPLAGTTTIARDTVVRGRLAEPAHANADRRTLALRPGFAPHRRRRCERHRPSRQHLRSPSCLWQLGQEPSPARDPHRPRGHFRPPDPGKRTGDGVRRQGHTARSGRGLHLPEGEYLPHRRLGDRPADPLLRPVPGAAPPLA